MILAINSQGIKLTFDNVDLFNNAKMFDPKLRLASKSDNDSIVKPKVEEIFKPKVKEVKEVKKPKQALTKSKFSHIDLDMRVEDFKQNKYDYTESELRYMINNIKSKTIVKFANQRLRNLKQI